MKFRRTIICFLPVEQDVDAPEGSADAVALSDPAGLGGVRARLKDHLDNLSATAALGSPRATIGACAAVMVEGDGSALVDLLTKALTR